MISLCFFWCKYQILFQFYVWQKLHDIKTKCENVKCETRPKTTT